MLSGSISIQGSTKNTGSQDFYPPAHPLQSGQTYPVRTLLQDTIIQSDNLADDALLAYAGSAEIERTFDSLQIPIPTSATSDDYTASKYSRLFRVLYNSTYLTPALSEQALELLSQTTFTNGLVAGVPANTTVAHKFGERTVLSPDGTVMEHELHDCGIVYYPGHPYFLCVMTRGSSFPDLAQAIASISHTTWDSMAAANGNG